MKKLGLIFLWLFNITALFIVSLGASMMGQKEDALLLFAIAKRDGEKLYLYDAATGVPLFLMDMGAFDDAGWSPDGRIWVLEQAQDADYRLLLIDAKTGLESTISESVFFTGCGGWLSSPDEKHLVYVTKTDAGFAITILNPIDETSDTIPVSGVEPFYLPWHWSPDGKYMLVYDAGTTRLYELERGEQRLSNTNLIDPSFSPDSRILLYFKVGAVVYYELATGISTEEEDPNIIASWSPSGRYQEVSYNHDTASYTYYDHQTDTFYPISLEMRYRLAAWSQDERQLLLYTFPTESSTSYPKTLISYELATGEVETLLETQGFIDRIFPNGDWLAISYLHQMPEDNPTQAPPISILLTNGESFVRQEIVLDFSLGIAEADLENLDIVWSPNGRWLSVEGYIFDTETAQFQAVPSGEGSRYWSHDSQYLAFYWGVWSVESKTLDELHLPSFHRIIGWQGRSERNVIICHLP